jgi:hypothetical protein
MKAQALLHSFEKRKYAFVEHSPYISLGRVESTILIFIPPSILSLYEFPFIRMLCDSVLINIKAFRAMRCSLLQERNNDKFI